ncbi:hypothetical protein B0J18DRAFT_425192 [Chaetomium sp. MPI-SDFR-AT-0129]|nr:hypothetical protein B0J18DRAFT_425192 [Chaetomium sp. MPI-SDFR-AT-0129]
MQLTTVVALLAGAAASVSAAALTPKALAAKETPSKFYLVVQSEDTAINGKTISASKSKLWLLLSGDKQNGECGSGPSGAQFNGTATLFLQDDLVFLYNGDDNSHQKLAVNVQTTGCSSISITLNQGVARSAKPPPIPAAGNITSARKRRGRRSVWERERRGGSDGGD